MTQVISFEDFTPAARFDAVPWSEVRIEEGAAVGGPFTQIDVVTLTPVDPDPAHPASRSFTTDQASSTDGLWYRLIFADATGNTLAPLFPVQNVAERPHYATVEELASLLKVNASSRRVELQRVLDTAAGEIDDEIGPTDVNGTSVPYATPPAVVVEVNIERAVEHWQQQQVPFGFIGIGGGEPGGVFVSSDSWRRHAEKLSFLKGSWGIA